jgi:hypothetical protein
MYGMEVSAQTITTITNKVLPLVEAWQSRIAWNEIPVLKLIQCGLSLCGCLFNRLFYVQQQRFQVGCPLLLVLLHQKGKFAQQVGIVQGMSAVVKGLISTPPIMH